MTLNVTLRQLRAIAALRRHGSMTRVAAEFNISPPAVTLQMKALEDQIGIALVERSAGGIALTVPGIVIADAAARIDAVLRETEAKLAGIAGAERGEVHVGITSTAKYYAPQALAAFSQAHPGIDLRLTVGNREDIADALQHHECDLAIMGRPPTDMKVVADLIGDHPHVIVARPEHPLAGHGKVHPKQLSGEVILVREPGSGTRKLMEDYFSASGIKPRIGMQISSNETIKQSVMAGLGIAFLSGHTIDAEIVSGRLAVLQITGLPIIRQWYAVHLSERVIMPACGALLAFLRQQGPSFLPKNAIGQDRKIRGRGASSKKNATAAS